MPRTELLDRLRIASAFLIGLTLPISVSLSEIFCGLGFVVLLAEWRPALAWEQLRRNRVAWAALALFAILGLGTLYSTAPGREAVRSWFRYRELLYLPLFMLICRDAKAQRSGLYGFLGGIVLILAVGTTPLYRPLANLVGAIIGRIPRDSAFGSYITEGMLVALGTYFFTIEAIRHRKHRKIAILLVVWGLLYALFLNTGRTGYVVLIIAAVMLLAQLAPRKFWLPGAALIIIAAGIFTFLSPRMHERMMGVGRALEGAAPITAGSQSGSYQGNSGHQAPDTGQMDLSMMRAGDPISLAQSSANSRIEFLRLGAEAFLQHPILGTGTGSFERTYAVLAAQHHVLPTSNPHNEYVLIAVQTGAVGLAALLVFFLVLWQQSRKLPLWEARQAQVLVLSFAVACLFNSLLMDHKDGHTFAFLVSLFFSGAYLREDQRRHYDL
jgi:O-antigen ligase